MKLLTPLKTIRRYCLARCTSNSRKLIRNCEDEACPNFIYRMGRNPSRSGVGVGIRGKNGRFQKKVSGSAEGFRTVGVPTNTFEAKAGSGNLGASGEEIGQGQIDLETKGKIMIKTLDKELVITVQPD